MDGIAVSEFELPDLWTHCPFSANYHRDGDSVAAASLKWFEEGCRNFTDDMRRRLYGLKAGVLTALCYNRCNDDRLRVICDFMNVLFLLDDLSDHMLTKQTERFADIIMHAMMFPETYRPIDTKDKKHYNPEPDVSSLTRDYWMRCKSGAGPELQARIIQNLELYLVGVKKQAYYRENGIIPTFEDYISLRRLTSGCGVVFDFLEYSLDLQLPGDVLDNPIMITMKDCVNDFISLSNDIFSYNAEQARGDTHSVINVFMKHHNLTLQNAVDHAGKLCGEMVDKYCENKAIFPSYGQAIDIQVAAYFHGLESWISGTLAWSFISKRYFGDKGGEVKKTRRVKLLSRS